MPAKKKTSAKKDEPASQPESKLPAWAGKLPLILIVVGALLAILGIATNAVHFTHAWLVSFMFFLSLGLGAISIFEVVVPAFPVSPPVWAVAGSLGLSISIGVIFGALPARRAARLDPVVALAGR